MKNVKNWRKYRELKALANKNCEKTAKSSKINKRVLSIYIIPNFIRKPLRLSKIYFRKNLLPWMISSDLSWPCLVSCGLAGTNISLCGLTWSFVVLCVLIENLKRNKMLDPLGQAWQRGTLWLPT